MMQKAIKLLENHPLTKKKVQSWFLQNLLKTINDEMPEEFKEFVRSQTIDDDKLATLVVESPRGFFDIFDINDIYININYEEGGFTWRIIEPLQLNLPSNSAKDRRDAESKAIYKAFEILEKKLTPKKDVPKTKEKSKKK